MPYSSLAIIWCHGGCFAGGHVQYDSHLRKGLFDEYKITVFPVDFRRTSYEEALSDIDAATKEVLEQYETVIIAGISSGGFLAHQIANKLHLPAFLICPVMKPASRHATLSRADQILQLSFFGTLEHMQRAECETIGPNAMRFILYGSEDLRAPSSAFADWPNTVYYGLPMGHNLCQKPPVNIVGAGLYFLKDAK